MKYSPCPLNIRLSLFLPFILIVSSSLALGAEIVVDRNDDSPIANACSEAPADCSIRGAIAVADALPTDDTIVFDPKIFAAEGVIRLSGTVLTVVGNGRLAIDGSAARFITLDGQLLRGIIHVRRGADVSISNLTLSGGNTFLSFGGGGVFNEGVLTLSHSTVSNNRAGNGGALYNLSGTMVIENSTICFNQSFAGAIATLGSTAVTTIKDSTVCRNTATYGGGLYISSGGMVNVENTIVSNNTAGSGPDVLGPIVSNGFNLVSNSTGMAVSGPATGDQYNVDPLLDPAGLTDNGGNSLTMGLLPGSPAIDTGNSLAIDDQRGEARPMDDPDSLDGPGNLADIGAFEFQPVAPPPPPPLPGPSYDFGGFQKPIDPDTLNSARGGGVVPVKFSLSGYWGMDIFLEGFPASAVVNCDSGEVEGDALPIEMPGNSGVDYDPVSDTYSLRWKTSRSWIGTCRRLILGLNDGSSVFADFDFR